MSYVSVRYVTHVIWWVSWCILGCKPCEEWIPCCYWCWYLKLLPDWVWLRTLSYWLLNVCRLWCHQVVVACDWLPDSWVWRTPTILSQSSVDHCEVRLLLQLTYVYLWLPYNLFNIKHLVYYYYHLIKYLSILWWKKNIKSS